MTSMSISNKQSRSSKSRPYRMRRRAEMVDQTHLRITEAAVRLHTTVGPAKTSIAGVADEAGVTRLTVYRHFADLDALFEACMGHWGGLNPMPDVDAWKAIAPLEARARRAFGDLYRWYQTRDDELYPIHRDWAAMPLSARQAMEAQSRTLSDALLGRPAATEGDGRIPNAVARHLVDFWTWRSLVVEHGLELDEAVDAAVRMLLAAPTGGTVEDD
jgi:AcrR family transcriptional regulator